MEDIKKIVIDNGSNSIKFGFAEDIDTENPKKYFVIPSVAGKTNDDHTFVSKRHMTRQTS